MSGGLFDYNQHKIYDMIQTIERIISRNNVEIPEKDRFYRDESYYEAFPSAKFYSAYSEDTIEEFKNAVKYLKIAYVYAHRVDWLESGDDNEESFHKRLKQELDKLEENL